MVEYKAYLKLKLPRQENILGLSWEQYNVVSCEYEFTQDINSVGEVSSGVRGGTIGLSISNLPTDELMSWVFDHAKKFNGEISILDTDGEALEQVYFEEARCVDFHLHYEPGNKPHTITKLLLIVDKIQIGDAHFEFTNDRR